MANEYTKYTRHCQIYGTVGQNNLYIYDCTTKATTSPLNNSQIGVGKRVLITQNGWMLECTQKGALARPCQGAYARYKRASVEAILRAPAIKDLATPVRGQGHAFSAKWKAADTTNTLATRPTSVSVEWCAKNKAGLKISKKEKLAANASSSSLNLADFTETNGKRYTRASFYPVTYKKVESLSISVQNVNACATPAHITTTTYNFAVPRKPSITGWSFNKNNGEVTFHIKTNEGKDKYERYDTKYVVKLKSETGKWEEVWNTTTTSTDLTRTIDLQNYAALTYSQYYQIKVEAWARGLAGDSEHVVSSYYVGFPALASIKSANVSGGTLEGRFTVNLVTNSTAEHFVQQVKLEYLADVTYKTAAEIPGSLPSGEEWVDAGIVDDAQCKALSVATQNLIPSPGKYTWYRIKTWCRNEDVLYRYTEPRRIKQLETPAPTAQDERITILESVALPATYNDGKTVALLLGWNKNGQDDATGTELSWTTDVNGWRSVTEPSSHEFTWSDGQITYKGVTYRDSATIYLHNLEENVPVFFKARRYLIDTDERMTYSPYSNTFTATPSKQVAASEVNVSVIADATIPANKSYQVEWAYDTDVIQTQYMVVASNNTTIATGRGTNQACQIPAERLATFAVNGKVTYTVRVLVSGAWIKSATRTVEIVPVPELTLDVPATLTAQPISFDAECDQPVSLRVVVLSEGVDGQRPGGVKRQANGDVVYSALIDAEWTEANDSFTATIELPSGLELFNNGNYTIEATPINAYGIEGEKQQSTTEVDWSHVAGLPVCEVEPIDETDDEGIHTLAVRITLDAPEGATADDVYDIYRLTGDGATLIYEGAAQDAVIIDKCAPYGDVYTYVRIATRTVDGDTNSIDVSYGLGNQSLRIDWLDQYVELPYNLTIQDAYTKDVEFRQHMDGTQDGYWNAAVSRNASFGSTLVKLWQQEDVDKVRALARYTGAVFVRTPDGSAYTADVQVSDLTPEAGMYTTVALSATEIDLVESFMAELEEE